MIARAESSVFWPGITPAITAVRANCNHCNRSAPSNPSAPQVRPSTPEYPFQCLCAEYDQYVIRVDGSRRVTLRNRKFLRENIPVIAPRAKLTSH